MDLIILDIHAIYDDFSSAVVKPLQELHESGLSAAWWSHKCYLLSTPDLQTKVEDSGLRTFVVEIHVFELDVPCDWSLLQFRVLFDLYLILILSIQDSKQGLSGLFACYHVRHEIEIIARVPASPSDRHYAVEDIEKGNRRVIFHDLSAEVEEHSEGELQDQLRKTI